MIRPPTLTVDYDRIILNGGAGGNRTLVRQAVTGCATTIPGLRLCGCRPAGSGGLREGGHRQVCFPEVSGLSRRQRSLPAVLHRFCCRAAADRPRVSSRIAGTLYGLTRSGGESEVAIGASFGAPFKESEQLRSHVRQPVSTSKPISPV